MTSLSAWNKFFKQFETDKARMMYSRWKYLVRIIEFITGEYVCTRCNMSTLVQEHPGEFRDFDADPDQGGDGVALCTKCIGTARYKKTAKFKKLQEEAIEIRKRNYNLLGQVMKSKNWSWYGEEVKKVNACLVEISARALKEIKSPDKNCLALKLQKKNR